MIRFMAATGMMVAAALLFSMPDTAYAQAVANAQIHGVVEDSTGAVSLAQASRPPRQIPGECNQR